MLTIRFFWQVSGIVFPMYALSPFQQYGRFAPVIMTLQNKGQNIVSSGLLKGSFFTGVLLLSFLMSVWYGWQLVRYVTANEATLISSELAVVQLGQVEATDVMTLESYAPLTQSTWFGSSAHLATQALEEEVVVAETTLNLALEGTIFGPRPRAILYDNAARKTHVLMLGESIMPQVTVAEVNRRSVVLDNRGTLETISLPAGLSLLTKPETTNVAVAPAKPAARVAKEAPYVLLYERPAVKRQKVTIGKLEALKALANLGSLSNEVKLIPRVSGGTIEGYKIFQMAHDSFFSKLTLKEGDIFLKLNGTLVSQKDKIFPMLMNLKSAREADVLIHRDGENILLTVAVG